MISNRQPSNGSPTPWPPQKSGGSIADKVVLIIGGVNENGRNLAADLAEQGAHIALVYSQQDAAKAQATKRQIEGHQRECLLIPAAPDGDKRKFARRVVQQVVDRFGQLDIFIDYSSPAASASAPTPDGRASRDLLPGVGMLAAAMNQITEQT